MGSVRARITALALVVVTVALASAGWLLLVTLRRSLVSAEDYLARAHLGEIADQLADGDLDPVLSDLGDDGIGQVSTAAGVVLASSSGLRGANPVVRAIPDHDTARVRVLRGVPDDEEAESYRVWVRRAETPDGPAVAFVGSSLESVSEAVRTVRRSLYVGIPALITLVGLGTRLVVGRSLRPVERIRADVAAIRDHTEERRITVPPTKDEIQRLARTMNDMLGRLESADRRQREFVADASHELQSPVTALRAQLEAALAAPRSIDADVLHRDLLADTDRLEQLCRICSSWRVRRALRPSVAASWTWTNSWPRRWRAWVGGASVAHSEVFDAAGSSGAQGEAVEGVQVCLRSALAPSAGARRAFTSPRQAEAIQLRTRRPKKEVKPGGPAYEYGRDKDPV
jgi:hypothetical protein